MVLQPLQALDAAEGLSAVRLCLKISAASYTMNNSYGLLSFALLGESCALKAAP